MKSKTASDVAEPGLPLLAEAANSWLDLNIEFKYLLTCKKKLIPKYIFLVFYNILHFKYLIQTSPKKNLFPSFPNRANSKQRIFTVKSEKKRL